MTHLQNISLSIQTSHNNYYLVIESTVLISILIHKTQAIKWAKKLNLEILDIQPKLSQ